MATILLGLLLLAAPAAALVLELPSGASIDDVVAPPGEPLRIIAAGPMEVRGRLETSPGEAPGSDGPGIEVQALGAIQFGPDAYVVAASGMPGLAANGIGEVIGSRGGNGGDVRISAGLIVFQGTTLRAGDGGAGGDAAALGAPNATAVAGAGGDAGVIAIRGDIRGSFHGLGGDGGPGGNATAQGAPGADCDGRDGMDGTHRGQDGQPLGNGEDSKAEAGAAECGRVDSKAGRGGHARAYGGNGGVAPNGTGGRGGDALAIGGTGGDGMDACFESTEAAVESGIRHAGDGGDSGATTAIGGNGGSGLNGGRGGSGHGTAQAGRGGNATMPIELGTGGVLDGSGGEVKGGAGGIGIIDGGGGGSGLSEAFGGDSGVQCGPLPYKGLRPPGTPGAGLGMLALSAIAAAVWRQRGRSP